MKKILVILTDGASYRNFINSGVIDSLSKKASITLVCAKWMVPYLKKRLKKIELHEVYNSNGFETFIDHIRKTRTIYPPCAYKYIKTQSLKIKMKREIRMAPFKYFSRKMIASIISYEFIQEILQKLSWISGKTQVKAVFDKTNFDIVFATNILTLDQLPYVEYAKKINIPVASMVNSWDNITSKGLPMYIPDLMMVWGEKQIEECKNLIKISEKIVKAVGAPQFDSYFKNEIPPEQYLQKRLNIQKNKKIITYIGGIPQNIVGLTAENEKHIIESIIQAIDRNEFSKDIILVIRPHPGVKDWNQYKNFEKHPKVRINYPTWFIENKPKPDSWNPDWEDHLFMGSLMKYSKVVITPGGSSTLDASCFDTPAINIYFDNEPKPYLYSLKSHCDFDHLKYVREYKSSPFVESAKELIKEIKENLINKKKYSKGRDKLVKMIVGHSDGKSKERIVKELLKL